MNKHVVILGAGEIGTALSYALKKYDGPVDIWDIDESKLPEKKNLETILPHADIVLLCVPSWAARDALLQALKHVPKNTAFVSLSKGIDKKTHMTLDAILQEVVASHPFGLLGGPLLAEEIMGDKNGIGVLASKNKGIFTDLQTLFKKSCISLEYTNDVAGAALCGVVKNVYAISLGVAKGLGLGDNEIGWAVKQALKEMNQIVIHFGGRQETVYGSAGLGDFIATGFSSFSSNYAFGVEIAQKGKTDVKCEGVHSLVSLAHKIDIDNLSSVPLFLMLYSIVHDKRDVREAWSALTHRCFNTKLCY
ncbi:hypothetical protein KKH43_03600 [Patescibacteria group bacterium]|nr:hypothetical protein [Patescibacteria group bacterium]